MLPSFIIILIVAKYFLKFKNSHGVKGIMSGLKPAVVGLIGSAVLSIGKTVFVPDGFSDFIFADAEFYYCIGIFITALLLAFKKVHPIIIICLSAGAGLLFGIIFNM